MGNPTVLCQGLDSAGETKPVTLLKHILKLF
jgi:hypothetical protein